MVSEWIHTWIRTDFTHGFRMKLEWINTGIHKLIQNPEWIHTEIPNGFIHGFKPGFAHEFRMDSEWVHTQIWNRLCMDSRMDLEWVHTWMHAGIHNGFIH